jgi:hypothetical protein
MLRRRRLAIGAWAAGIGVVGRSSLSRGDGVDLDSPGSQTARVAAVVDAADGAEWRRVRRQELHRRRVYGGTFGTGDEVVYGAVCGRRSRELCRSRLR